MAIPRGVVVLDDQKQASHSAKEVEESRETERTYGIVALVNLALWVLMLSVVGMRSGHVRHFTYPMTTRFRLEPNYTRIESVFTTWGVVKGAGPPATSVFPFNEAGRVALRDEILSLAHCAPVVAGGASHSWGAQAVSPMCDCLDNLVATKIMAHVGGNASRVGELEALSLASIIARAASAAPSSAEGVKKIMWDACLSVARPTQVEDLLPEGGFFATNIVYNVLTWCTVGLMASVYVSGIHETHEWRGWGSGALFVTGTAPPLVVIIMMALADWHPAGCMGVSIAIVSSLGVAIVCMTAWRENIDGDKNKTDNEGQAIRNATVTSFAYGVGALAAWNSFSALTQHRDHMYSIGTGAMVICMAILSYAARYAYQIIVRFESEKGNRKKVFESYREFFSAVWYCNALIVAGLLAIPGTGFDAGPFSNANRVAFAVVCVMFLYPILQRVHTGVPKDEDAPGDLRFVTKDVTTFLGIDVAARAIMVSAVAMDLWSTTAMDR